MMLEQDDIDAIAMSCVLHARSLLQSWGMDRMEAKQNTAGLKEAIKATLKEHLSGQIKAIDGNKTEN